VAAETRYRERVTPTRESPVVAGLAPTPPPPAENSLIRVEPAQQIELAAVSPSPSPVLKPTATPKSGKLAKNKKTSPTPAAPSPAGPPVVAQYPPPIPQWPPPRKSPTAAATPLVVAGASPVVAAPPASPARSVDDLLASTAGGGVWQTYPPGKMPVGRLIQTSDLTDLAERGLAGERVYLKGQFVVNFTEPNRAVLRPKTRLTDAVLHPLSGGKSVRIVVEFPAGYTPPTRGTTVTRDEARPYEITEVRKQADGQLNVFVREIMQ
jgi:hypothetical protein